MQQFSSSCQVQLRAPGRAALILVSLLMLLAAGQARALCFIVPGSDRLCWNPVNPVPAAFEIEHIEWSADTSEYLAVGQGGAILTSPDGVDWTPRDSGTVQPLFSVVRGAGVVTGSMQYVAVGDGGLVVTSPDGVNWTPRQTGTRLGLRDIAWSGSLYVAVGEEGLVMISVNGVTWTELRVIDSRRPALFGVTWHDDADGGRFIAVGSSSAIISSSNGTEWVDHEYTLETATLRDIAVSPADRYVAVGGEGSVFTSDDGETWTAAPIPGFADATLNGVVWNADSDRFIAVGDENGGLQALAIDSPAGSNWSAPHALPGGLPEESLKSIAYDSDNASLISAGSRILLSTDDATVNPPAWQQATADPLLTPSINDLLLVEFADPLYLAAGAAGSLLTSPDGLEWSPQTSGVTDTLRGLAWNGDDGDPLLVAVGDSPAGQPGTIIYSEDGLTWNEAVSVPGTENLAEVVFGNGLFVAVGDNGTVVTSSDGNVWTAAADSGTGSDLLGVSYALVSGSPFYIAVGAEGTVITSSDAATWQQQNTGVQATLNAVVWNEDGDEPRFVAVGLSGAPPTAEIITSSDGVTWIEGDPPPTTGALRDVAWNGSQYLAASVAGDFLRSVNGQQWTTLGAPGVDEEPPILNALLWVGDRFLAAGEAGNIHASGGVDIVIGIETDTSIGEEQNPAFATGGTDKTYRFTVSNIGNLDATGVQFVYTLAPTIAAAGDSAAAPAAPPDGWTCTLTAGGGVTCATDRLTAATGASVVLPVTVPIPDGNAITISHQALVSTAPISDANPTNNALTVDTRITPSNDPVLPDPDTSFNDDGALGSLDIPTLLLALAALGFRLAAPGTGRSRRRDGSRSPA